MLATGQEVYTNYFNGKYEFSPILTEGRGKD
jgi:hypothetical protein